MKYRIMQVCEDAIEQLTKKLIRDPRLQSFLYFSPIIKLKNIARWCKKHEEKLKRGQVP